MKTLHDAWIPEFGSGMDSDPAGFRVVGSGPDVAGTKMSRSGLDPDLAGSENCGSGAPLLFSAAWPYHIIPTQCNKFQCCI